LIKRNVTSAEPIPHKSDLEKEALTMDAELKRTAKGVIDKILHLRDSL